MYLRHPEDSVVDEGLRIVGWVERWGLTSHDHPSDEKQYGGKQHNKEKPSNKTEMTSLKVILKLNKKHLMIIKILSCELPAIN